MRLVRQVYARVDYLKLWIMRSVFEARFVSDAYIPHYVCDLDVRPLKPHELRAPESRLFKFGVLFAAKELGFHPNELENGWAGALSHKVLGDRRMKLLREFYLVWTSLCDKRLLASTGRHIGSVVYVSMLQAMSYFVAKSNGYALVQMARHGEQQVFIKINPVEEALRERKVGDKLVQTLCIADDQCDLSNDSVLVKILMRPKRRVLMPSSEWRDGIFDEFGRRLYVLMEEGSTVEEVRDLGEMPYEEVPVWEIACFGQTNGEYL